jgi:AcrR family transcriptional regulator
MDKAKSRITTPRRELIREEFLNKAAEVFERKGFSPTRISDVAEALSLSRSALYHYFKSKDEILSALVEEHTEQAAERMEKFVRSDTGSPATKLRALLTMVILSRMSGGARIRVLDQLAVEMPPKIKAHFEGARRRIFAVIRTVIQDGIDSGEFRSVDPRTAALAVIGIAVWTSWWYSPSGRQTPQELADVLVDIAINGLTRQSDDPRKGDSSQEIIGSIRRQLSHLEKLVAD